MVTVKPDAIVRKVGGVSDEEMAKLYNKVHDPEIRRIVWGQFGTKTTYSTLRDAYQTPSVVDMLRQTFTSWADELKTKKKESAWVKGANEEVREALMKFPVVLMEPNFVTPDPMFDLFIEEGKINLPYPKMVVLEGDNTRSPQLPDRIDTLSAIILAQADDGAINIHVPMSRFHSKDTTITLSRGTNVNLHIATVYTRIGLDSGDTLGVMPAMPGWQMGWLHPDTVSSLITTALRAIYMLTYHTGEVMMFKPTAREVEINTRKINKGKKPLIEFKLVSITGKETHKQSEPHGTHASPKQHWRRGHWRTYPKSGKRVWIEPALVGDEKNGKIIKDYAIGNYRDSGSHAIMNR